MALEQKPPLSPCYGNTGMKTLQPSEAASWMTSCTNPNLAYWNATVMQDGTSVGEWQMFPWQVLTFEVSKKPDLNRFDWF